MKQSEVRVGTYAMLTVRGRAMRVLVRYQRTPERAGDVRWEVVDDNGDYHEATPRQLRPVSSGMSEPIRFSKGARVVWQREGRRAQRGTLTDDCAMWHSFATVQLDGAAEPLSVWAGDVREAKPPTVRGS